MSLVRKLSFLSIQMNYTIEDVRTVKLTRTIFQVFFHYIYFMIIKRYFLYRKVFKDLTLYDDGIVIKNSFIPYEYVVSSNIKHIIILAKQVDQILIPFDSLLVIDLTDMNDNVLNIMRNNIYYHLKYNMINLEILNYKSIKISV